MNEKTKLGLIALSLIAVIFVAGCAGGTPEGTEGGEETTGGETASGTGSESAASFAAAMSSGESYKCVVTTTDMEELNEMTIWVKGGDARVEYATSEGKEYNQINKDDTIWWWDPQEKTGITRTVTAEETEGEEGTGEESSGFETEELETSYEWECTATSVSDSKFNPPDDVEFIDMSEGFSSEDVETLAEQYGS
ncbi:MAG: hypothetical protein R6U26_00555 [Candidatus Undinarchaeales archaeon]